MGHQLKIIPDDIQIDVEDNTDLLSALLKAGIPLRSTCAGNGTCGTCRVVVKSGDYFAKPSPWISPEQKKQGCVLACQTAVLGDLTVEIPAESKLEEIKAVGQEIYTPVENVQQSPDRPEESIFSCQPLAYKIHLTLPNPTLKDNIADFERLKREIDTKTKISNIQIDLPFLKSLSQFVRQINWDMTVTLVENDSAHEIIQIEPGNTEKNAYGIALDIGTTTVVAYLVNLSECKVVSAKASYNRQMSFGDDVISRIIYAEQKEGLKKLNRTICETINDLISALISENKLTRNDILAIQCAGNTTMIHLFLGISPEFIRKEPYIPAVNYPPPIKAAEIGLKINPKGIVSCVHGVSSYIGGDITAGVLACGMHNFSTVSLLIDLGTNGEIVLGNKDWLVAAACSAGPSFEGVGIKSGIRAVEGAIQGISIIDDKTSVAPQGGPAGESSGKSVKIKYTTIGDKKPKGICGSGLIDIPGELLKNGIIDRSGRFVRTEHGDPQKHASPGIQQLIRTNLRKNNDDDFEFVIVPADETSNKKDVVLTESDIANIIRSKGAIFLGIQVLLEEMGLGLENINHVFVSGGFGTYLDVEKSVLIGLLPDIPREKFSFIGNSSITGAKMCILSKEARQKAIEIANEMTYIELSVNTKFMNEFTSALFLPHTDINLFPTVKKRLKL